MAGASQPSTAPRVPAPLHFPPLRLLLPHLRPPPGAPMPPILPLLRAPPVSSLKTQGALSLPLEVSITRPAPQSDTWPGPVAVPATHRARGNEPSAASSALP